MPPVLQEPTYKDYVARIPSENQWKLERELDFENGDVDLHLADIADLMVEWESLAPKLKLDPVDIHDINAVNQSKPKLQR